MRYTGLDPAARYKVRVVYGGDSQPIELRLMASQEVRGASVAQEGLDTHAGGVLRAARSPAGGTLSLQWSEALGQGGAGRGVQV